MSDYDKIVDSVREELVGVFIADETHNFLNPPSRRGARTLDHAAFMGILEDAKKFAIESGGGTGFGLGDSVPSVDMSKALAVAIVILAGKGVDAQTLKDALVKPAEPAAATSPAMGSGDTKTK